MSKRALGFVLVVGCARAQLPPAPSHVAAKASPPPIMLALLRDASLRVVEVRGGAMTTMRELAVPGADGLYWVGTPGDSTIAVSWVTDVGARVELVQGDHLVEPTIPWPTVDQPPNTELPQFVLSVAATPDHRELDVTRCWFKYPDGPETFGPCALATVARIAPGPITVLDTIADPPENREGEVKLPALPPPARVRYTAEDKSLSCRETATSDDIELAQDQTFAPRFETVVIDPPIVRVDQDWFGLVNGGTIYALYEGCAKSERFDQAIPMADGTVILRGNDLAVVRDGRIIASAPGLDAKAVAFPPLPATCSAPAPCARDAAPRR